jgi:hypothetical protein
MTTIACSLKEMAADTRVSWEGVGTDVYTGIKLFPSSNGRKAVFGITGEDCTGSMTAVEWLQKNTPENKPMPPDYDSGWDWKILELSPEGIAIYNERLERDVSLEPVMAVGSGRKVAYYCMKYLHMSPAEAVREACKVDHWSEVPIYVCKLEDMKVVRWVPAKKKLTKAAKPKENDNAQPSQ